MSLATVVGVTPTLGERLAERLSEVVGVLNRAHADLVDIVAEALATEAWGESGMVSPQHWLVLRAGLSPSRAQQVLALARRTEQLPATMSQFSEGQLSLEQASVIARHTPTDFEASVADLAPLMTVPQIRRAVRHYVFEPEDPGAGDPVPEGPAIVAGAASDGDVSGSANPADASDDVPDVDDVTSRPPTLRITWAEHNRFQLWYDGPAVEGALIEAALSQVKDAAFRETGVPPTLAESFGLVIRRGLGDDATAPDDRVRVYVHLDTNGGWVQGKARLPEHVTRRYTCDGALQPVWERDGKPVSVGRTQRIVPQRTRRLVQDRDRGCRFPGCPSRGHVDIHHVVHWMRGGPTDTANLVCLCSRHHDGHHRGDFSIAGDADIPEAEPGSLAFTTRYGLPISAAPPPPAVRPAAGWPSGAPYRGPVGERLHTEWITFTRADEDPSEAAFGGERLDLTSPPRVDDA